ncbi:MAG: response regulator transcription factor [Cyclobacteriaceae bacterium]|nr:response regulator transcription factor [Cyclobacteriaceae bacterium HetDA_MAG_MS6]
MRVVIVEDERLSAQRLEKLVIEVAPEIEVIAMLDSVAESKGWFIDNTMPDLMFLDIQLNDGTGFDLLDSLKYQPPVIFTTAYDEYAIRAFKFNSVDYLLKPIEEDKLRFSIKKFRNNHPRLSNEEVSNDGYDALQRIISGNFKKRFLIKIGEKYQPVDVDEIAFFIYKNAATYVVTKTGLNLPIDQTLEQLSGVLNPLDFFRVNRKMLISLSCIKEINTYFNSRLLLQVDPDPGMEAVVSRERVSEFKRWMDL